MNSGKMLWTLAVIVTLASALFQRMTGPSYPIRFNEDLGGVQVKSRLLRTHSITRDLPVIIQVGSPEVTGKVVWRRYPTNDEWVEIPLVPGEGTPSTTLETTLPRQGMAGKVEYYVELENGDQSFRKPADEAAVARFKGDVPFVVLLIHIILMFGGMLYSSRAGFEALASGPSLAKHSLIALCWLTVGGFILGPIVQKYAFDAYWTGWPLGEDLTDNKLAAAVLVWVLATWRTRGAAPGRAVGRWWAVAAMLIVFVVFSIPHSLHGSTLDYETGEHIQTSARQVSCPITLS
ncbi:MAG: hypothetical protein KOO60_07860 [Gemmatimonadales bacterium]|nr:hypothetical protein [Gemmatimonadales bacterium]